MLHPQIKEKRDLLDFAKEEFLRQCGMNSKDDLEQSLNSTGFKLKTLFAHVPFPEIYEIMVEGYEKKIENKEIRDYVIIPAWWVPHLMDRIVEKNFVPFAVYVI